MTHIEYINPEIKSLPPKPSINIFRMIKTAISTYDESDIIQFMSYKNESKRKTALSRLFLIVLSERTKNDGLTNNAWMEQFKACQSGKNNNTDKLFCHLYQLRHAYIADQNKTEIAKAAIECFIDFLKKETHPLAYLACGWINLLHDENPEKGYNQLMTSAKDEATRHLILKIIHQITLEDSRFERAIELLEKIADTYKDPIAINNIATFYFYGSNTHNINRDRKKSLEHFIKLVKTLPMNQRIEKVTRNIINSDASGLDYENHHTNETYIAYHDYVLKLFKCCRYLKIDYNEEAAAKIIFNQHKKENCPSIRNILTIGLKKAIGNTNSFECRYFLAVMEQSTTKLSELIIENPDNFQALYTQYSKVNINIKGIEFFIKSLNKANPSHTSKISQEKFDELKGLINTSRLVKTEESNTFNHIGNNML